MENFDRKQTHEQSSDRTFGCVMAGFFALVALLPMLSGKTPRLWAFVVATAFLLPALLFPRSLSLLNKLWTRFGLLLSSIMSPIASAVMFFGVITPYGWLARKFRKDAFPIRFDAAAKSYWITRTPPGPEPQSLKDQF
jgi:hypothetical protein